MSTDGGRTWQRRDVSAYDGAGRLEHLDLRISPDGADVWLLGYSPQGAGSLGRSVARKLVGLPALWLHSVGGWQPRLAKGHSTSVQDSFSLAAVGAGLMLVSSSGQAGAAFAGDVWTPVELTPRPDWVHTLRGGTVVATSITHATLYLGTRTGREIRWVRVVLKQS